MPLHPQVSALLNSIRRPGAPLDTMTVAGARAAQRASTEALGGKVEPVSGTVDITAAPSPAGGVRLRIHRPLGAPAGQALGGVLYLHGGGWVAGDLDTHDRICRGLANRSGAAVIAVDYRLAPEHPFPAGLEDALAALAWSRTHAAAVGVDPTRLAVAGDSAGANLAAVLARRDRDAGGTPPLALQVLVYPITDAAMDTSSYTENGEGLYLTRADMEWYWGHYMGGADPLDPDASPLRAADLSGLPPALVLTAEYDPLRDEGEAYAERLRAAGVPVECRRRAGMVHGFLRWGGAVDEASTTLDEIGARIREALERR